MDYQGSTKYNGKSSARGVHGFLFSFSNSCLKGSLFTESRRDMIKALGLRNSLHNAVTVQSFPCISRRDRIFLMGMVQLSLKYKEMFSP